MIATVGPDTVPDRGTFVPRPDYRPASLPTLMRKVHDLAECAPNAD